MSQDLPVQLPALPEPGWPFGAQYHAKDMRAYAESYARACMAPLQERADALQSELERERMRLVACGVLANANTRESLERARVMHPDYNSGSSQDVAKAVEREIDHRERADALEAALNECVVTMQYARIFTRSREQMHPDGRALFDDALAIARSLINPTGGES